MSALLDSDYPLAPRLIGNARKAELQLAGFGDVAETLDRMQRLIEDAALCVQRQRLASLTDNEPATVSSMHARLLELQEKIIPRH